jgi:hypothetical protein
VDTAFGINGAHVDGIYQAALDAGFRIVDVRHEVNAGHAAEGYARVRGDIGVAIVTAGGGFTNVLTSVANAHLDRTPVVYIAGSGPPSRPYPGPALSDPKTSRKNTDQSCQTAAYPAETQDERSSVTARRRTRAPAPARTTTRAAAAGRAGSCRYPAASFFSFTIGMR